MARVLVALPAVAAALISYALTPLAGRLAVAVGAMDLPGPRKIHQHPIPRLGGVAVVAATLIVGVATFWLVPSLRSSALGRLTLAIALGGFPIVAISIRDDIKALGPGVKAAMHLLGASIAVALGVRLNPEVHLFGHTIVIGWLAMPLSVVWLVGVTNAFNIVDGLDGLSAGLALISAFGLWGVFMIVGQTLTAAAVLVLAGAVFGFLPRNLFPARMFFGDTGATAVGFCLAAFALKGGATLSAGFAALLPIFLLGLPVAETIISMSRRFVRRLGQQPGGGVFQPDRNHIHHRLLALGITHARAVFILHGAGFVLAGVALASMTMTASQSALLLTAVLLTGVLVIRRLDYEEFAFVRSGAVLKIYDAPFFNTPAFVMLLDVAIVVAGVWLAVALKTDDWTLAENRGIAFGMIAVLTPITLAVFTGLGVYKHAWRVAGVAEIVRAWGGVLAAALLAMTARMLVAPGEPLAALFSIYTLVAFVLVAASRASYQVFQASRLSADTEATPVLIYGAGRRGAMVLHELPFGPERFRAVAFLDDDASKIGRLVNGVPVVGPSSALARVIAQHDVHAVIVAAEPSEARLGFLNECCERLGVAVLKLHFALDTWVDAPRPQVASVPEEASQPIEAPAFAPAMAAVAPAAPAMVAIPAAAPAITIAGNLSFESSRMELETNDAGQRCPSCKSYALHRSHSRKMTEAVRKRFTQKRLYRCQACGWRGWSQVTDLAVQPPVWLRPMEPVPLTTGSRIGRRAS